MLLHLNGSRAFLTLSKHVKNNFNDCSLPTLLADYDTLITSSE